MSRPIIEYYEKIELISQKMLIAAKNSAWDELCLHETNCKVLINELRSNGKDTELTATQRKKKHAIMLQILKNGAQIRLLVEPWLSKVDFASDSKNVCLH